MPQPAIQRLVEAAPNDRSRSCNPPSRQLPSGNLDAAVTRTVKVGEPFDLGRHVGELVEPLGRQQAAGGGEGKRRIRHAAFPSVASPNRATPRLPAAPRKARSRVARGSASRCASSR